MTMEDILLLGDLSGGLLIIILIYGAAEWKNYIPRKIMRIGIFVVGCLMILGFVIVAIRNGDPAATLIDNFVGGIICR